MYYPILEKENKKLSSMSVKVNLNAAEIYNEIITVGVL